MFDQLLKFRSTHKNFPQFNKTLYSSKQIPQIHQSPIQYVHTRHPRIYKINKNRKKSIKKCLFLPSSFSSLQHSSLQGPTPKQNKNNRLQTTRKQGPIRQSSKPASKGKRRRPCCCGESWRRGGRRQLRRRIPRCLH